MKDDTHTHICVYIYLYLYFKLGNYHDKVKKSVREMKMHFLEYYLNRLQAKALSEISKSKIYDCKDRLDLILKPLELHSVPRHVEVPFPPPGQIFNQIDV